MIKKITAKTVIHKHGKAFPVMHDVNPYRGCTIGCRYCFAQYSHYYIGLEDFFRDIIVKTNTPECLDRELSKMHGSKYQIKIGGVTDAYQPLEKKTTLMPDILAAFKKHRIPIFLSTKSDLILRDFELIRQLAEVTSVDLAVSISCYDESNAKLIEPGATSPKNRLEALSKFNGIVRSTSVLNMPIIPYISDSLEELEALFQITSELEIDNMVSYPLSLRSAKVKQRFFKLVERYFPNVAIDFVKMYLNSSSPGPEYGRDLTIRIESLRAKYQLYDTYTPLETKKLDEQLNLF